MLIHVENIFQTESAVFGLDCSVSLFDVVSQYAFFHFLLCMIHSIVVVTFVGIGYFLDNSVHLYNYLTVKHLVLKSSFLPAI